MTLLETVKLWWSADSYYILIAGGKDLSEDGNRDQEMERVKQGSGDHLWLCTQLSKVKFQTSQLHKVTNFCVIEVNLDQDFYHLQCN